MGPVCKQREGPRENRVRSGVAGYWEWWKRWSNAELGRDGNGWVKIGMGSEGLETAQPRQRGLMLMSTNKAIFCLKLSAPSGTASFAPPRHEEDPILGRVGTAQPPALKCGASERVGAQEEGV
ncbi:hypothetical protein K438DRAFT_1747147 [Mycena galopus ATCC 62051]|nr:hypothetical protein K438DRAFT_1747147 [Mycena galopus ATCC 62051]